MQGPEEEELGEPGGCGVGGEGGQAWRGGDLQSALPPQPEAAPRPQPLSPAHHQPHADSPLGC